MKATKKIVIFLLTVMLFLLIVPAFAQDTCEPKYSTTQVLINGGGVAGSISSNLHNTLVTIGQPLQFNATNHSHSSTAGGFWGIYKNEPRPPVVRASDGDFQDMILVEWTIEGERTGAPITGDTATLYRNGYVLTTLPITQTEYQDFNVFPGEYYTYSVEVSNDTGTSYQYTDIGFLNPNGVITGHIETPSGNPVLDTKVTLSPNMGRSALFSPDDDAYVYFFDKETSANRMFDGFEENYTIETWFRSITDNKIQYLFSAVDSSSTDHYLDLTLNQDGKLEWTHSPSGDGNGTRITTKNKYSGFDLNDNANWHHVACVFDNNEMTMYVDGFIVGETTASSSIDKELEIIIGKKSPQEHTDYYLGRIDDFRIWSQPRSWNNIRKYMDITLSGEEWGLAGYWKFDEVEGDIVFDLTDNDIDGTVCRIERDYVIAPVYVGALSDSLGNYAIKGIYYGGGTTFTVTPSKQTNIGRAIKFNGVDDYIAFEGQRVELEDGYTFEGWFKTPSEKDMTLLSVVDPSDNSHRVKVMMNTSGNIIGSHFDSEISAANSYNDNLWHHWAVTYDNSDFTLYLDGVLESTISNSNNIENLSEIVIARETPETSSNYFEGILDEMRLWNVARNSDQINGTKNQPLNGDEYGLANYWKMNDGADYLITDATSTVTGTLVSNREDKIIWTEDIPLREMFDHYYEPESRQATLNNSNTAVDLVDFTDISMIPISGYVRYEGTACFQEGVEILRNGESFIPPIYTDENGKWVVELEPGSTGDIIEPFFGVHEFLPPFVELPMIATPRTGLYFSDQKVQKVTGIVAGGDCHFPITPEQSQIEVTASAICGCYEVTVVPDTTGVYEIKDLPPFIYNISMNHPDPDINSFFEADTLSLEDKDREFDFIYHSDPQVEFINLPETEVACDDYPMVLTYPNIYQVGIRMYEPYGDNKCEINDFEIQVFDNISDTTYVANLPAEKPKDLAFTAKTVNLFDSGDHPYQKNIHIVVTDSLDRTADADFWALIQGDEKIPGVNFSTTTSKMPWYVLRVPPGDGSSTYMSTGQSLSTTTSYSNSHQMDEELNNTVHLGNEVTTFVGAGLGAFAGVISTAETTFDIGANFSFTQQWVSSTESVETLETSETYSTSGDGITGDDATVYIGGGYTVDMGLAKYIHISGCEVKIDTVLTMNPNGVHSTYIHSKYYVKNVLMPNLMLDYSLNDNEDSLDDYNYWQKILDADSTACENAVVSELLQIGADGEEASNISFDAGASLEYQYTNTNETSSTDETTFDEMQALYLAEGFELFGLGFDLDQTIRHSHSNTESEGTAESTSETIGFILDDDDPGDGFAFSVKADAKWGMPVFELIGGQSSAPYEEGTVIRQKASISIPEPLIVGTPVDQPALFTITINNESGTSEEQTYSLSLLNESNPGGAIVTCAGINLGTGLYEVTIPGGSSQELIVSVEIGQDGYDYDDLELQVGPTEDIQDSTSDWGNISVHFQQPASEISIAVPEAGFLVSSAADSDTLWVTLNGYDRTATNLESIELQYRRASTSRENDLASRESSSISYTKTRLKDDSNVEINNSSNNSLYKENSRKESFKSLNSNKEKLLVSQNDSSKEIPLINSYGNEIIIDKITGEISNNNFITPELSSSRDSWLTAYSVPISEIYEDYIIVPWNISPSIVIDGQYELRAKTVSSGLAGNGYSIPIVGTIDRNAPEVFGNPHPIDGILDADDMIAIHFDENINTEIISIGNQDITLTNTVTGQLVDFTYTAGFNTITIEPAVNNEWIENQTLRVDINYIEDIYGNAIDANTNEDDRISWEFFVNRNPIGWTSGGINDVVLYIDETFSTTKVLRNNGGSNRSFNLIGGRSNDSPSGDPLPLPDWLEVTPQEGTLTPGDEIVLNISLVEDIAAGWYKTVIYANGIMGDEPLPIDIRVLEYAPEWQINEFDFEYSMTITANLVVDGDLSEDVYDAVGVFVDGELRGTGQLEYIPFLETELGLHPYEVFLTVYSNELSGENLEFKVWDATESTELGLIEEAFTFEANTSTGTPTSPTTITATSQVIGRKTIARGWNWLSLNLENDEMDLNNSLGSLNSTSGDIVKSQTQFAQFVDDYGWAGNMASIDTHSMFLIKTAEQDTLEFVGYPVNVETDTIEVVTGWNWISYLPQTGMSTNNALISLEAAATGDVIKSQTAFAQYVENYGWIGSLNFMEPFKGYLLKLTYPGEIVYPFETPIALASHSNSQELRINDNDREIRDTPDWSVEVPNFEFNMNIIGKISYSDGEIPSNQDIVAAFVGDECRGIAYPQEVDATADKLVFLTVYANSENEVVEFKVFRSENSEIFTISEEVEFINNHLYGNVLEPQNLNANELVSNDNQVPSVTKFDSAYPNPFNPTINLSYSIKENTSVSVSIYNIRGQKVRSLVNETQNAGRYTLQWSGLNSNNERSASGIYFVRFKAGNHKSVSKIMLLK